ncbi:LuxR C-terminal-related transcriptional regulator [[Mycobacterium] zoologicum]|uniref:LuxR C-terminal-related transcriptional regulator n=1 Tax=[Mycobacterium] zoologicum TaxID=2872311 RepID=UPI001CDB13BD|nr:LuxR C-terminal-related transcriptional regulator [Mycolicibacter sp. MYC101]MEB3061932.1 LuxR C-terminal-related transcriptional regulator [Mycolicibacter sp. MYC101]
MTTRALLARLNDLDQQLCRARGISRSGDATTLDEAITMAAATTDRVMAGQGAVHGNLLAEYLQAQVEARETRANDRVGVVRSLTAVIRRMRKAESLHRLGRQACGELCETLDFDHALLSFIENDGFVVEESDHGLGGPTVIPRRDCGPEAACIRRRETVRTDEPDLPATPGYLELLESGEYLVAPVIAKGEVVALLHAGRRSRGGVTIGDSDVLDAFASAFSLLYERMLNLERVQHQRDSIARAAARLTEEAERIAAAAISLDVDHDDIGVELPTIGAESALGAALSGREREVFERLVRGASNADIAEDLVVTVETVKTHVKRILRKIGAINRSEAIALYLDETKPRRPIR